jgi:hypothetical protein
MKRFLRLLLLAGVLTGLAAWLKEIVARAEPPAETADTTPATRPGPSESSAQSTGNGSPTREELYEEAQRLEIEGRSKMNKGELEAAVRAARA